MTVAEVFYGDDRTFGSDFEIAPLAERGETRIRLGGQDAPMRSEGLRLAWPGNAPESGMEVTLSQGGNLARIAEPGLWGFLRVMDETSVRNRDEGRRQLVDLRTGGGRLFFELSFSTRLNPIAARKLLQGITCPAVL